MSEVEISNLAPLFLFLYVGFFILNFGATMAYLTRYHVILKEERSPTMLINIYLISLVVAMFSFFAIPANFAVIEFPGHGWKLWHGEIGHPKNKWFCRAEDKRYQYERSFRRRMEASSKAGGLCNSIWEESL